MSRLAVLIAGFVGTNMEALHEDKQWFDAHRVDSAHVVTDPKEAALIVLHLLSHWSHNLHAITEPWNLQDFIQELFMADGYSDDELIDIGRAFIAMRDATTERRTA